ncbi:MAG: ATP-binding cassette domain-containing protein, partial [Tateyamaria sp.]
MSLLEVDQITASYGAAQALFGVDLHVQRGEVLALLGRNGMGKSTTIRAICRLLSTTSGSIRFDGRDLARVPAHRAARAGLGLVPEGRRVFAPLTVRENLVATARPGLWTMDKVTEL